MSAFTFDIDFAPIESWFSRLTAEPARRSIEVGLYEGASEVMRRAKEIVPIGGPPTSPYDPAPGTLRDSGVVMQPEWNGDVCTVSLGFGGAAEEYAWRQHEDLTYHHKPGQSAKFLERPLDEERGGILDRIVNAVARIFEVVF